MAFNIIDDIPVHGAIHVALNIYGDLHGTMYGTIYGTGTIHGCKHMARTCRRCPNIWAMPYMSLYVVHLWELLHAYGDQYMATYVLILYI